MIWFFPTGVKLHRNKRCKSTEIKVHEITKAIGISTKQILHNELNMKKFSARSVQRLHNSLQNEFMCEH